MNLKKIISILVAIVVLGVAAVATALFIITSDLPKLITVADYEPLVVSQVFDRNGKKIGEFFREQRILTPYAEIPQHLVHAFVDAEDDNFFDHGGVDFQATLRALLANIRAGRKVQGGSTITMQVARSLLLSREKTYTRKIKEVALSFKMENNLSKEDILWLYLNQIYLGQGAYGVASASQIYFRKPLKEISVAEAALLAGLPQAPSRYSPIYNPQAAKARQLYVLKRMAEEGHISPEQAELEGKKELKIYLRQDYKDVAPFFLETVRQLLVKHLGEVEVLDKGIKVYTSLDVEKQQRAQEEVQRGLRDLDKRQGYRGPLGHFESPEDVAKVLIETRNSLLDEMTPVRILMPDGTIPDHGPLNLSGKTENGQELPTIPPYIGIDQIVKGVVTGVDDQWGLVTVRFAESRGLIDFETMEWARKPNPKLRLDWDKLKKPSEALSKGDIILVKVVGKEFRSSRLDKLLSELKQKQGKKFVRPPEIPDFKQFAELELEQEPSAEAALLALDQKNGDIISMVGGYDFARSQFNRSFQAARQTGSSFKALVYAAALDKGYTPATPIIDAPVVYEDETDAEEVEGQELGADDGESKRWKPMNHSQKFSGDVLFRNALIRSMNVPTVKIIEKLSVDWVAKYARRLGIFSPLNMDFTLALGSSGVTLYEMVRSFAQFGTLGKRIRPIIIHKVESAKGDQLMGKLSFDDRFEQELKAIEEEHEKRRQAYLAFKRAHPELANGDPAAQIADAAETEDSSAGSEGEAAQIFTKEKFLREPPIYFDDPDQLMRPQTAYVMTTIMQGAVEDPSGTGGRARALGRPVAGKTGTTNGYYDAWFIGFTPDIATGVWVGYDEEKTLGRGEVGGRSALPIWLEYMKSAHEGLPLRNFAAPDGIVYANIDNDTGKLATANSNHVVRQAFIEGTEPTQLNTDVQKQDDKDFYKEEMGE